MNTKAPGDPSYDDTRQFRSMKLVGDENSSPRLDDENGLISPSASVSSAKKLSANSSYVKDYTRLSQEFNNYSNDEVKKSVIELQPSPSPVSSPVNRQSKSVKRDGYSNKSIATDFVSLNQTSKLKEAKERPLSAPPRHNNNISLMKNQTGDSRDVVIQSNSIDSTNLVRKLLSHNAVRTDRFNIAHSNTDLRSRRKIENSGSPIKISIGRVSNQISEQLSLNSVDSGVSDTNATGTNADLQKPSSDIEG
jgi:hypothetical protein